MKAKKRWLRAYVEQLVGAELGVSELYRDEDGDYPFRFGTASCWVSLPVGQPKVVAVFAHAAIGVKSSAKLLAELNDIQAETVTATVQLCDDKVIISQTISVHGFNRRTLRQAVAAVGTTADGIGLLVAGVYGGLTPFQPEIAVDEEAV